MKPRKRPSVSLYIVLRVSALMALILVIYYFILDRLFPNRADIAIDMTMLASAFFIILLSVYFGSKRVEKQLQGIKDSLEDLDSAERLSKNTKFATKEFEEINGNLVKVLKKAKKREDDKQKYNTKLKLKNRQRSEMLSAIAHEFRNPISVIMGYAETLQDDPDISLPLRRKFLGRIYGNGQKIEDLLSRLILWNKFESGEAKAHMSSFDIYNLACEAAASLEEKYKNRDILIEGSTTVIEADRTLMEIVLKNLMENALKYSKDRVTVEIDSARLSVTDRGIGIESGDIDKVTKKFYRSGKKDWDNSMGLGLSIVKKILDMHGSELEIKSTKGVGSTFSFRLRESKGSPG